jgi:hypothetical protein
MGDKGSAGSNREDDMRKTLAVLIALCAMTFGFAMVAPAGSETAYAALADIPFGFYAGNQWMPAGKYRIDLPVTNGSAHGSMLRFYSRDGSICQYLITTRTDGYQTDGYFHLVFNKYGDTLFFARLSTDEFSAQAVRSRTEKRLAIERTQASGAVSTVEVVAAPLRAK